ncbi:MAG: sialidase family protein [Planctomycetota bacterium]|nr:sialidase family protein [Planctomycetota bacterium]
MTNWNVGIARRVITPQTPVWLAGYGSNREPDGKIHDLWVKVLALRAPDGKRVVMATTDHMGMSKTIYESLYAEMSRRFSLDRSEFMITFSHNHCGPVLKDDLVDYYPLDEEQHQLVNEYTDWMEGQVTEAVAEALDNWQPAQLFMGEGKCTFAVNRRENPEAEVPQMRAEGKPLKGVVDHYVPVLAVRGEDEKLLGLLFGYACHPTTLNFKTYCGDYPGFAQVNLEARHPDTTAMFFNACGADQNPIPRRKVELCEQYGKMLSDAVEEALVKPMRPVSGGLRSAFEFVDLDYDELVTREKLLPIAAGENAVRARWANRMLKMIDAGVDFPTSYPYPVQTWNIGNDLLLIAIGGEAVVDYSLRFKREFGPTTWVCGYANDMAAYIPSRRVWEEGGYEGGPHLDEYGRPAWLWKGDIEDRIVGTVHRLARKVGRICTVKRELYLKSTIDTGAVFMSCSYLGAGTRRQEVFFEEHSDDYFGSFRERFSDDNGRNWTEWQPVPARKSQQGEAVLELMDLSCGHDPVSGKTIHLALQRIFPKKDYTGGYHDHTLYRLSADEGRTWSEFRLLRYEDGPEFDEDNWVNPEYLETNQLYAGYNVEATTSGTLVTAGCVRATHTTESGEEESVTGVRCFAGRWNETDGQYDWSASAPLTVSTAISSRGLLEPAITELKSGDLLLDMRGSSSKPTPGRAWVSISSDGGMTWSPVRDLRYDDGDQFYSPSTFVRMLRSHRTGKLYWVGNITPTPPQGNMPRHPLVIAEIDEPLHALKRSTVTVIDALDFVTAPEPDMANLQLTNFAMQENRETEDFEIYMTRYWRPKDRQVWLGHVYRYVLSFLP